MCQSILLTLSQAKLVCDNLPLVQKVKYQCVDMHDTAVNQDDIQQEGCLGLCKAAATFDGSCKFTTYATAVIRNQILSYCRSLHHSNVQMLSLDKFTDSECSSAGLIDEDEISLSISVTEAIRLLQERRRGLNGVAQKGVHALQLKLLGFSGREIANIYQVSPNLVGAWISRAAVKLRQDKEFLQTLST